MIGTPKNPLFNDKTKGCTPKRYSLYLSSLIESIGRKEKIVPCHCRFQFTIIGCSHHITENNIYRLISLEIIICFNRQTEAIRILDLSSCSHTFVIEIQCKGNCICFQVHIRFAIISQVQIARSKLSAAIGNRCCQISPIT